MFAGKKEESGGGGVSASQTSLHGARLVGVCKPDRPVSKAGGCLQARQAWEQGWWVSASLTEPGGKAGGCLQVRWALEQG